MKTVALFAFALLLGAAACSGSGAKPVDPKDAGLSSSELDASPTGSDGGTTPVEDSATGPEAGDQDGGDGSAQDASDGGDDGASDAAEDAAGDGGAGDAADDAASDAAVEACVPIDTCPTEYICGSIANGCGGQTTCGACLAGETCTAEHRCQQTTVYFYDSMGRLVGEYETSGAPRYEVAYMGETPLAVMTPSEVRTVHADHLGTPRALADATDKIVWRWDGDAFGASQPDEDPDGDAVKVSFPMRFPGQLYDAESGLHYNYFRDYDPSTGRYLQADPIGLAGGPNLYGYVDGAPTQYTDPSGLVLVDLLSEYDRAAGTPNYWTDPKLADPEVCYVGGHAGLGGAIWDDRGTTVGSPEYNALPTVALRRARGLAVGARLLSVSALAELIRKECPQAKRVVFSSCGVAAGGAGSPAARLARALRMPVNAPDFDVRTGSFGPPEGYGHGWIQFNSRGQPVLR